LYGVYGGWCIVCVHRLLSDARFVTQVRLLLSLPPFRSSGDAFATAALIRPALIQQEKPLSAAMSLSGEHSRGAIFFDWLGIKKQPNHPNTQLVQQLDQKGFEEMLRETFSH
jgi:hypothetical protein